MRRHLFPHFIDGRPRHEEAMFSCSHPKAGTEEAYKAKGLNVN